MGTTEGAGLRAVARVRTMREQDSLFGLHHAVAQARESQARVEELDARMTLSQAEEETVEAFLDVRRSMLALGTAIAAAQGRAATDEALAVAALGQWQSDRTRLEAIELLQEQRAAEHRAEALRLEARDLDEAATQGWIRRNSGQIGARG